MDDPILHAQTSFIDVTVGLWNSACWMQDLVFLALVASVHNSKSIGSVHSPLLTLDLNQKVSSALFQSYSHIVAAYDLCLILIVLSDSEMTHSIFVIFWKECLSAQTKQMMVFNAI